MIIWYILVTVYILAINLFAFLQVRWQHERAEEEIACGGGKLLLAGVLGGAITAYAAMFKYKYKLNNILYMVGMPVLAALNVYIFYLAYRSGFGIFVW